METSTLILNMHKILLILTLVLVVFILGRNLNPLANTMFEFHDITQPARIQQFTQDLKHLQIPPRMTPDFSFGLGYPVFNFYAPASYWITSIFSMIGIDPVNSLKLSFLLCLITAFLFTYLFLRNYFDFYASLAGSVSYVTALYFAIDIFVRGNLAETWFLALMPAALLVLFLNAKTKNRAIFIFTVIILSLTLTVHNLLSLLSIPVLLTYILIQKNRKRNAFAFILALLLGSYFFIPMLLESSLTYATQVAKMTNYHDHFLCSYQLWQSPWGYGGSIPGCNDGMSFKLGKLQIILFSLGFFIFIIKTIRLKVLVSRFKNIGIFLLFLTISSLFLTTYQSQFIWDITSPVSSLIQFPWRFIAFSLIGMSFFISYFVYVFPSSWRPILAFIVVALFILFNSPYFYHPPVTKKQFEMSYLTSNFIKNEVAYKIAEYLPRTADYKSWRSYENKTVPTGGNTLPITYFPYWSIKINDKQFIPTVFDVLGRPIVNLSKPALVTITYRESPVERFGNIVTLASLAFLFIIIANNKLWNKIMI